MSNEEGRTPNISLQRMSLRATAELGSLGGPIKRVVAVIALALVAVSPARGWVGPRGVGMHPVSREVASFWYTDADLTGPDSIVFIVYLIGPTGWVEAHTTFKNDVGDAGATIRIFVGDTLILADFKKQDSQLRLFGRSFDVRHDNVFVVRPMAEPKTFPTVKAIGLFNLKFDHDANPATELISREAGVKNAVQGNK